MPKKFSIQKKKYFNNSNSSWEEELQNFKNFYKFLNCFKFLNRFKFRGQMHRKQIRKNLKKIANKIQNPYIISSSVFLSIGFAQMLCEYMGVSVFGNNLSIININKFTYDWKTFHVLNSSHFLNSFPLSDQYQKFNVSDTTILIKLNPTYQNQRHQTCFGFIPLKEKNSKLNNFYYNSFSKSRTPILLNSWKFDFFNNTSKSLGFKFLDAIPNKMEGAYKIQDEENIPILIKKDKKYQKPKVLPQKQKIKNQFFSLKRNNINLKKPKFRFVKQNDREIIWKNDPNFPKTSTPQNEDLAKFHSHKELRNYLLQTYRSLFHENNYKPTNFKKITFIKPKWKEYRRGNVIFRKVFRQDLLRKLVRQDLDYLDVLKIIDELELSFFIKILRPRFVSEYWFPDIKGTERVNFFKFKPFKIQTKMSAKYQTTVLDAFSQTIQNQKQFLSNSFEANFDKLHENILYPKVRKFVAYRNKNYKKQLTIYKTSNYLKRGKIFNFIGIFEKRLKNSSLTLGFKNKQFYDIREPVKLYSWLILTRVGICVLGFKILQHLYQEYGKEIIVSVINLLNLIGAIPDSEWLIDELHLDNARRNYRAVRRVKKSIKQAAGITSIMMHFSEILWYLRAKKLQSSGFLSFFNYPKNEENLANYLETDRPYHLDSSLILRPILLIGAPGTGKTLLVQALAGECGVPVLLQSGSVLKNFRQRGRGARSIQNLFRRARRITPCIIFIDEIDGVGVRRQHLSLSPTGERDLIDALDEARPAPVSFEDIKNFQTKTKIKDLEELEEEARIEMDEVVNFGETLVEARQKDLLRIQVLQELQAEQQSRTEQISILTQLLIELDGLTPLNDIMVLGATNRPHILDPALLRPGRFYKIVTLKLPDQRKRIKILKLYVSKMKQNGPIPWSYLARMMEGLSAADISAIVNESALISIYNKRTHTMQSLEQGFDRITSYSSRKNLIIIKKKRHYTYSRLRSRWSINPFFAKTYVAKPKKRFVKPKKFLIQSKTYDFLYSTQYKDIAYYQAGKAVVQISLPQHPSSVFFALQDRVKNFRYMAMHGLVLSLMEDLRFRSELEERVIGLLAGKAGEFLYRCASLAPHLRNASTLPIFDISSIGIEDTSSATLLAFLMVEKWYFYAKNICTQTYHSVFSNLNIYEFFQDEVRLFQAIFEDIESEIDVQNKLVSIRQTQKWSFRTWWQKQVIDEQVFFDKSIMDWYRIYLPEPEESEQNIEWVPPDDYYTGFNIRRTNSNIYWHHFLKLAYDYLYHSLIMNSFNVSFSLLNKNCELLDYLVDFVLRYEKVRKPQIDLLISRFIKGDLKLIKRKEKFKNLSKEDLVILKSWGNYSKRSKSRTLTFQKDELEKDVKDLILESFQKIDIPKYLINYPNL